MPLPSWLCASETHPRSAPITVHLCRAIVISENVSLDGVVEDPAGDEGFGRGGWVGLIKDRPELNQLALDEALGAGAFLLGRRSYEWFALPI